MYMYMYSVAGVMGGGYTSRIYLYRIVGFLNIQGFTPKKSDDVILNSMHGVCKISACPPKKSDDVILNSMHGVCKISACPQRRVMMSF